MAEAAKLYTLYTTKILQNLWLTLVNYKKLYCEWNELLTNPIKKKK